MITQDLKQMMLILSLVCIVLLIAIATDLIAGLRKAKLRGEIRTSYGLSRTATKMITYYGALTIGACIDAMMLLGGLWRLFGLSALIGVPIVAIIIGIFLCFVELFSIRESADAKIKKSVKRTEEELAKMTKSELVKFLAEAFREAQKHGDND